MQVHNFTGSPRGPTHASAHALRPLAATPPPDFLSDFDKLRKGEVHPDNFMRGMSMAGVDKFLNSMELKVGLNVATKSWGRKAHGCSSQTAVGWELGVRPKI